MPRSTPQSGKQLRENPSEATGTDNHFRDENEQTSSRFGFSFSSICREPVLQNDWLFEACHHRRVRTEPPARHLALTIQAPMSKVQFVFSFC